MTESVTIVPNGSQPKTVENEMRKETDDSIKMNGTVKLSSVSAYTATTISNDIKPPSQNEVQSSIPITEIGFDIDQIYMLSLKFFKSEFVHWLFSSLSLSIVYLQAMRVRHFMHLTMIAIS